MTSEPKKSPVVTLIFYEKGYRPHLFSWRAPENIVDQVVVDFISEAHHEDLLRIARAEAFEEAEKICADQYLDNDNGTYNQAIDDCRMFLRNAARNAKGEK